MTTYENNNAVLATLAVAFWSLQNAATQLAVARVLAPAGSGLRSDLDQLFHALEDETAALSTTLDRLEGREGDD